MGRPLGWLWAALLLACAAYQWVVHWAIIEAQSPALRVALIMLPLLALAYWIVTRARRKIIWLPVLLAAGGTLYALEHLQYSGVAAAYGIPHAAIYAGLLWVFGRTLKPGAEPLVTRLARRVHGGLPPVMETYTRRVTIAWCVFFGGQIVVSLLLFLFSTLDHWSLFITLLNLPLLALMFGGEYAYRITRHPDFPHASLAVSIRAFAADDALSKKAEAR